METSLKTQIQDIQRQLKAGFRYIPLATELPVPLVSTAEVFKNLAARGDGSCFLFSRGEPTGAQLHVIGLDPFETISIRDGRAELSSGRRLEGPALKAVHEFLQKFKSEPRADLPFFHGGAFGYLTYDFVRHLEPRLKSRGYFKKLGANELDGRLMLFRKIILLDQPTMRGFAVSGMVFSEGAVAENEIVAAVNEARDTLEELKHEFLGATCQAGPAVAGARPDSDGHMPLKDFTPAQGKGRFFKGVRSLKEEIRNGEIFQAVLADRFRFNFAVNPHDVFAALNRVSPTPYQFHLEDRTDSKPSNLLGASPEMLVRVEKGIMETHPIAGTRPRGRNSREDRQYASQLKRSVKENAEHLMLVDLARNDLGQVAEPGSVEVTRFRELVRYSAVMHLVSRVIGKLRADRTPLDALAACFPAGTLSGAPKIRAMELLAELEATPRGVYGGAVVALSFCGDLDSCITIRALQVQGRTATLQAGAGVVADSTPAREYKEVEHKTRSMRRAVFLARSKQKTTGAV